MCLRIGVFGTACLREAKRESVWGGCIGGIEWGAHAIPEAELVLHQGHASEAPQDHVVVVIVSEVLDGQILEQNTVRPKDSLCLGTHLLSAT